VATVRLVPMRKLLVLAVVCIAVGSAVAASEQEQCSSTDGQCSEQIAGTDEVVRAFEGISRRCARKKTYCGKALNVEVLYEHMRACAENEDREAEEDTECRHTLQEILILGECADEKRNFREAGNCMVLMQHLVFSPVDAKVIKTLAAVQWQVLFTKSLEWPAIQNSFDEASGIFYLQPYRTEDKSPYGRIAFGHRVTEDDFKTQRFVGGVSLAAAHKLLMEDLQSAAATAEKELGQTVFQNLPLRYQMVAADFVYSCGTTHDHKGLIEALLSRDRRRIKAELLRKPRRPRSGAVYRALVK